jgi:hypothetical protein
MGLTLSYHAKRQSRERFPKVDIHAEIKDENSFVEIGGQREKSKAYLTKSGLVLIVEGGTVITVYSKQMYFGNVAVKVDLDLSALPVHTISSRPNLDKQKEFEKQQQEQKKIREWNLMQEFRPIVSEHLETFKIGHESRKERHAALKRLGYTCKAIQIYDNVYSQAFYNAIKI